MSASAVVVHPSYMIEVQSGYEGRITRLLRSCGVEMVLSVGMGYLSASLAPEVVGQVRTWRGVRAVLTVTDPVQPLTPPAPASSTVVPGMFVRVPCGTVSVVGRVKAVEGGACCVVFSLLGRPVEQTFLISDVSEVPLPEVWR
jgi:hypothetical protein